MGPASSYSRPLTGLEWPPVVIRPLGPLLAPLIPSRLPSLPSAHRNPTSVPKYSLTTHIVPAAFPRSVPDGGPSSPSPQGTGEARATSVQKTTLELYNAREAYERGTQPGSQIPTWNCVNRYCLEDKHRRDRGKALTVFFAHANGFPKEMWEPTIEHVIEQLAVSDPDVQVDEFWCWEATHHGDAALLNQEHLGSLVDWTENTRDMAQFLLHYLPAPTLSPLPVHLPRLPDNEAKSRRAQGYVNRRLIVVGHSFGGTTSALLAIRYPRLFTSLVLIDPVIRPSTPHLPPFLALITSAVKRRERWESRDAARASLAPGPFFAAWDPRSLDLYIECGMCDDSVMGGVKLKMPGMVEAAVFSDHQTSHEVWQQLHTLDDAIELRWIMPGLIHGFANDQEITQTLVWRRPANASNVRIGGTGHLIPQEAPRELGQELAALLGMLVHDRSSQAKL